jgi:hypothetical protein
VKTFALYRHFDAQGALLYVGVTSNIVARSKQHSKRSHWWHSVARTTTTLCETRTQAYALERATILEEGPRFNVVYGGDAATRKAKAQRKRYPRHRPAPPALVATAHPMRGLPTRVVNALGKAGVSTREQLAAMSTMQRLCVPNIGRNGMARINAWLGQ